MNVLAVEEEKYRTTWGNPAYRTACHSLSLWQVHCNYFPKSFTTALDIGCGTGRLFDLWNKTGIDAWAVDLVDESLDPDIRKQWGHKFKKAAISEMEWIQRFDVGICTDVMEHIPPELVTPSLERIAAACRITVLKIAHQPSGFPGGPPLHLTIKPPKWWGEQMSKVSGTVEQLPDVLRSGQLDSCWRWTC